MGFNSFLKIFLPKDKVFFTLFEQVCENLESMAHDFHKYLSEHPDKINELLVIMKDGEHKNDDLTHQIFIELGQNFITPFDREDIHYLAMALDDVADYMFASIRKLNTYGVKDIDNVMIRMAELTIKGTQALGKAVHELRDMKHLENITESCVLINNIENQADVVLDDALKNLFQNSHDAISIIKLKDIYQDMEIITDKCEEAAHVIESIIIKYS